MTNSGYNDNSCNVENIHSCNTIAYPGFGPMKYQFATEGARTYDDPITAAASGDNGGVTELESQCGARRRDLSGHDERHGHHESAQQPPGQAGRARRG
jgi:hypothetical protein